MLAAVALALGWPVAAGAQAPLTVSGGKIVDQQGRNVTLRGVNVNGLGDYWQARPEIPATLPLTADDFRQISALGLNSVRLLVHWSRLEPRRGDFDGAYLAQIRQAVRWARGAGLVVVLDMHQDAWGKGVATKPGEQCPLLLSPSVGWDGAPDWTTITDNQPNCRLVVRELSPSVMRAWQSFWDNRNGIRTEFARTWAWLAGAFAGDPTVVGYDILNEPNWGEDYERNLYGGRAAMYREVLAAIRAAERPETKKLVFFEPFALWSAWPSEVTYRWAEDPNVVYAPHIYAGSITLDKALFGQEIIPLEVGFQNARTEAAYLGRTPVWVGEWGWFGGQTDYWKRFAAYEDAYQFGSAVWQWKQACGDPHGFSSPTAAPPSGTTGNIMRIVCGDPDRPAGVPAGLDPQSAAMLSRPYPRAFPGSAVYRADVDARALTMSGTAAATDGPVELWVPGAQRPVITVTGATVQSQTRRPGGWLVTVQPSGGKYAVTAAARG